MKPNQDSKLFPALIAGMGDWTYYISFMVMGEVAERVSIVQDIHHETALKELLQRGLTKNADKIAVYLQMQQQRFFNAIVVGTYGGSPQWHEVTIRQLRETELSANLEGALGFLELSGKETLFAIDGQHRVAGMKKAIEKEPSLASEEIAVIFVRGVAARKRDEDPEGYQRTRRLFTTLNRNAKPVQKKDIIALDEDDVVAIITRDFLEGHPLFQGKVSVKATKSIPPTDQRHFTSIVTLYDVLDMVVRDRVRGWIDFKKLRPSDSDLQNFRKTAESFWELMCQHFPPLFEIRNQEPADNLVAEYRNRQGGNIIFRPVGLLVVTRAITDLVNNRLKLEHAIADVSEAPLELAAEPWRGLLWDRTNDRMITEPKNQTTARRLLYFMAGGKLRAKAKKQLTKDLAGAKNVEYETLDLDTMAIHSEAQLKKRAALRLIGGI